MVLLDSFNKTFILCSNREEENTVEKLEKKVAPAFVG